MVTAEDVVLLDSDAAGESRGTNGGNAPCLKVESLWFEMVGTFAAQPCFSPNLCFLF